MVRVWHHQRYPAFSQTSESYNYLVHSACQWSHIAQCSGWPLRVSGPWASSAPAASGVFQSMARWAWASRICLDTSLIFLTLSRWSCHFSCELRRWHRLFQSLVPSLTRADLHLCGKSLQQNQKAGSFCLEKTSHGGSTLSPFYIFLCTVPLKTFIYPHFLGNSPPYPDVAQPALTCP